jgi:hypothetical protein
MRPVASAGRIFGFYPLVNYITVGPCKITDWGFGTLISFFHSVGSNHPN